MDIDEVFNSFSIEEYEEKYSKSLLVKGFELLLEKKGIIIACAASPGEIARCWNGEEEDKNYIVAEDFTIGSVFTRIFLSNMYKECSMQVPCWFEIFKKTKNETIEESKSPSYSLFDSDGYQFHTPLYKIFLGEKRRSSKTYMNFFLESVKRSSMFLTKSCEMENDLDVYSIFLMPSE